MGSGRVRSGGGPPAGDDGHSGRRRCSAQELREKWKGANEVRVSGRAGRGAICPSEMDGPPSDEMNGRDHPGRLLAQEGKGNPGPGPG